MELLEKLSYNQKHKFHVQKEKFASPIRQLANAFEKHQLFNFLENTMVSSKLTSF